MQVYITIILLTFVKISEQCLATGGGGNPVVTPNQCTVCTATMISIITGTQNNVTPTSVTTTDASGCAVVTFTCGRTPVVATDVAQFTYFNDATGDLGTAQGTGSVNAQLTCVNGRWEREGIEINSLECQVIT